MAHGAIVMQQGGPTQAAGGHRRFVEETSVRTYYWLRVGAVTGLTAIALQEAVDFSLQMPGNAALVAVVCAIALHKAPERNSRQEIALPIRPPRSVPTNTR